VTAPAQASLFAPPPAPWEEPCALELFGHLAPFSVEPELVVWGGLNPYGDPVASVRLMRPETYPQRTHLQKVGHPAWEWVLRNPWGSHVGPPVATKAEAVQGLEARIAALGGFAAGLGLPPNYDGPLDGPVSGADWRIEGSEEC
jgi:hypothetical protein